MEHYERHYGIQLLDDLHNYFPSLLYDSRRFTNVQDVLQYIISVTQNRFNLFQRGQQNYRYSLNQTSYNTPNTMPVDVVAETIDITPLFTTNLSSLLNPIFNNTNPHISTTQTAQPNSTIPVSTRESTTRNLPLPTRNNYTIPRIPLSILSYRENRMPIVQNEMTGIYDDIYSTISNLIRPNLEPVIVHPTPDQIDNATTLVMIDTSQNEFEDEGEICSICQDGYTDGQAVRKINHCDHSFHKSCIDEWFERNVHCPICRYDIRENSEN
jgi:hypothetical protein